MSVNLQYSGSVESLVTQLLAELTAIDLRLQLLETCSLEARTNAVSSISEISGPHGVGDFVPKRNIVVAGVAPNKYIAVGWMCTVQGTPGSFDECRCLTGT